jgi:hypothetical protein
MIGLGQFRTTGVSLGNVEQALHEIAIASAVSSGLSGLGLEIIDHLGVVGGGGLELLELALEGLSRRGLGIGQLLGVTGYQGFVARLPVVCD